MLQKSKTKTTTTITAEPPLSISTTPDATTAPTIPTQSTAKTASEPLQITTTKHDPQRPPIRTTSTSSSTTTDETTPSTATESTYDQQMLSDDIDVVSSGKDISKTALDETKNEAPTMHWLLVETNCLATLLLIAALVIFVYCCIWKRYFGSNGENAESAASKKLQEEKEKLQKAKEDWNAERIARLEAQLATKSSTNIPKSSQSS